MAARIEQSISDNLQNFHNECYELANDIVNDADRQEGIPLEEYIADRVRDHTEDMTSAYADGLIYLYGFNRAIRVYVADCQEQGMNPYPLDDDEESMFSNSVLSVIMENPVKERVMTLLMERQQ